MSATEDRTTHQHQGREHAHPGYFDDEGHGHAGPCGFELAPKASRIQELEGTLERARPVLEFVSRGRHFRDSEGYPDARARRALGELNDLGIKKEA